MGRASWCCTLTCCCLVRACRGCSGAAVAYCHVGLRAILQHRGCCSGWYRQQAALALTREDMFPLWCLCRLPRGVLLSHRRARSFVICTSTTHLQPVQQA